MCKGPCYEIAAYRRRLVAILHAEDPTCPARGTTGQPDSSSREAARRTDVGMMAYQTGPSFPIRLSPAFSPAAHFLPLTTPTQQPSIIYVCIDTLSSSTGWISAPRRNPTKRSPCTVLIAVGWVEPQRAPPEQWGERPRSLKLEKSKPVDQLPHPALRLIAARGDLFRSQGSVVAAWRRRNGKTFGPYYRLSYRQHGRQCSVYLGRMARWSSKFAARSSPSAVHCPLPPLRPPPPPGPSLLADQ